MIIRQSFVVFIEYCGPETIWCTLKRIWDGENHPHQVDARLNDKNFPQTRDDPESRLIHLAEFDRLLGIEEDPADLIRDQGYVSVNAAELLSLRADYPRLQHAPPIAGLGQVWFDGRYRYVPCIHKGSWRGLGLRLRSGGWHNFWRFAVKKADSA